MNLPSPTREALRLSGVRRLTLVERWRGRLARTLSMAPTDLANGRTRRFGLGRPRLPPPRLPRPRLRSLLTARGAGALAALALCIGLGWLWFRSSSFVQIQQVTVSGLSGPHVGRIRSALTDAARSMTTLNLSVAKLDAAVSAYPTVHSLRVRTEFPHGVRIAVNLQVPLAEVTVNGRVIVVDGAGELLPESRAPHGPLPNVPLRSAPSGDRITAPGAMSALAVLQAAPYRLLGHVETATWSPIHGVILRLRQGPEVYFGAIDQLAAKWTAAIAVLADSASHGAQYIDVADPRRPAAGVPVAPPTQATGTAQATGTTQSTGTAQATGTAQSTAGSSSSGTTTSAGG